MSPFSIGAIPITLLICGCLGAICASPAIVFEACRKLRHPIAGLFDAEPSSEIELQIRAIASTLAGVVGLERCNVRKVGFSYCVHLHVIVHRNVSVTQGHDIAQQMRGAVLRKTPRVAEVVVQVNPDSTFEKVPY
jgi:divalent metal cation (Fe/Co/Zn/Cd) transporter